VTLHAHSRIKSKSPPPGPSSFITAANGPKVNRERPFSPNLTKHSKSQIVLQQRWMSPFLIPNLWRPTRRAEEYYTKCKLSTRRGAVHSIGWLCHRSSGSE
jgi:hypothetical protein